MKRFFTQIILALSLLALGRAESLPIEEFTQWPAGSSPTEIGHRVAERFLSSPHLDWGKQNHFIVYPEVCAWYGALNFAQRAQDKELSHRLVERFAPVFLPENNWMIPPANHVDACVFGALPLELYRETKQVRFRVLGLSIADAQWDDPRPDGLTNQTRFWIDDMFMITMVQVQAFRVTGEKRYLDRAANEMVAYLKELQRPNGLFYHAPDVPFYWGRGNGWVAVGMTEMLRSLPKDHPQYKTILAAYKQMMTTLLSYQTPEGLWRQLIDKPEAWVETSCSGMFTYAFVSGVKEGWLDRATYAAPARKAWLQLITYLDQNSDLKEVCVGTNKTNDYQFYLHRPRNVGDLHGQAPLLWSATALLTE